MEQAKPVKNPALKKAIKDARKEPNEENSVRPVSYTHLDVYKRQR